MLYKALLLSAVCLALCHTHACVYTLTHTHTTFYERKLIWESGQRLADKNRFSAESMKTWKAVSGLAHYIIMTGLNILSGVIFLV